MRVASDWSIVIISTLPNSLTKSRVSEYFRVVGIHSDGSIHREISVVCYPVQHV